MKYLLIAIATLSVAATANGIDEDPIKRPQGRLQGTWVMHSSESDGQTQNYPANCQLTCSFTGDDLVIDQGNGLQLKLKIELGRTDGLRTFDLIEADGKVVRMGVYKIDGDTFSWSQNTQTDSPRATVFNAPKDSKRTLVVWKRVNK